MIVIALLLVAEPTLKKQLVTLELLIYIEPVKTLSFDGSADTVTNCWSALLVPSNAVILAPFKVPSGERTELADLLTSNTLQSDWLKSWL